MHRKIIAGGAVLAASMAFAAPALADTTTPIPLSFNNAVLKTPGTGDAAIVSPSTKPLTLTADVDTTTGAFTVAPSDFNSPSYTFTSPAPGTATISLNGPASGAVNPLTGAVTMTADFVATISLNGVGSCTIDTGSQTLTTAGPAPLATANFPTGETGVITGNGAFGVDWPTLPAGTGSACTLINSAVDGPGGLWIARTTPPAAPKLAVSTTFPKSVAIGKTATVDVTVKNTGGPATKAVKLCLAPNTQALGTFICKTIAAPKANSTKKVAFNFATKKVTKAGSYKLKLTATGLAAKTVTLKLVKK